MQYTKIAFGFVSFVTKWIDPGLYCPSGEVQVTQLLTCVDFKDPDA